MQLCYIQNRSLCLSPKHIFISPLMAQMRSMLLFCIFICHRYFVFVFAFVPKLLSISPLMAQLRYMLFGRFPLPEIRVDCCCNPCTVVWPDTDQWNDEAPALFEILICVSYRQLLYSPVKYTTLHASAYA